MGGWVIGEGMGGWLDGWLNKIDGYDRLMIG
jgi:hypothetical protein